MAFAGDGYFPPDVVACVAVLREDQQHGAASFDRINDFIVERPAGMDVARRNPAPDAAPFELIDDFESGRAVLGDMADEEEQIGGGHYPLSRLLNVGSPHATWHPEI